MSGYGEASFDKKNVSVIAAAAAAVVAAAAECGIVVIPLQHKTCFV